MDRPAGAPPVPVPRLPRQPADPTNNGNPPQNPRDSMKAITKSIVQRRTQMFEHGNVGTENNETENVEPKTPTPPPSTQEEMEVVRSEVAQRTPEDRSPNSPKKLSRTVPPASPSPTPSPISERRSPQCSPTHVAKSRRTPSPRLGSPVRSHKHMNKCQPKIILGAAPMPVEVPVKPPRSKKPSVKLKSQDEVIPAPTSPNIVSPTPRTDVLPGTKPTPVRRAPDIPSTKPQKPIMPPTDKPEMAKSPDISSTKPQKPIMPPTDMAKSPDIPSTKPQKPIMPPDTSKTPDKPQKPLLPTDKPDLSKSPEVPLTKPQKPWLGLPGTDKPETGSPKPGKPALPEKSGVVIQRSGSKVDESMRPQKPPIPDKPDEVYTGVKVHKPALPEKPDDINHTPQKSPKPAPPEKPDDISQNPQKSPKPAPPEKPEDITHTPQKSPKPAPPEKPDGLSEKNLQPNERPEWLKKRSELMKTRSMSEPLGDCPDGQESPRTNYCTQTLPKYAVVDKSKKRNRPKSGEGPEQADKESYYDNVASSDIAGDIQAGNPDAPPKPPRTFAHDVYLKKKAERREKRRTHSGTVKIPQYDEVAVNGTCTIGKVDRIEPYAVDDGSNKIEPYAKSTDIQDGVDGGGGRYYDEVGGRRPAPPPRPKAAPQRPPAPVMRGRKDRSPLVKMYRHNSQIPEEGFIKSGQRKISNPSYDRHHSIIPIKTYRDHETGALKRHKSDEYLYADPQVMMSKPPTRGLPTGAEDPIYQDPVDVTTPNSRVKSCITPHGVSLDEEGYAIPDTMRHTMGRKQKFRSPSFNIKGVQQKWGTLDRSKLARLANHDFRATLVRKKLPSVREKVSRAYSILHRRPPVSPEGQPLPPASSPEDDDEDSQVDLEEHRRRMAHVNSLKEKHYATLESAREGVDRRSDRLFDYSLVVGLEKDPNSNNYKPSIIYKYPDQLGPQVETIAEFCFPDAEQWRPVTQAHTEDFSFVLTSEDGAHHYGYCRRLLPPGSQNRLPEVYCIVSSLNAQGFYLQLLAEFDRLRKLSPDLPFHLIKAAYAQPIPVPGREAWIACPVADGKKETVILKRSNDSRLDKDDGKLQFEGNVVSFSALFKHLTVDTILKIFGAVLLERRLLFTAQHLSTLSSCVTALSVLLYPFSWQHTFVPVLPVSMLDVCCAPTPYILGVLSTAQHKIRELELEEVLIVDLDTNSLIASMGDENAILPKKLQKCLRNALAEESELTGVARDTVVFEAFLRMFVETTGHYTEFMNTQQDGELVFQKEQFIKAVSSKSIRLFLEWFVETQMFEVFITDKLRDGGSTGSLFETRIEEYRDEMEQMSLSFKDNVKQIGRRMMTLVTEAGGKLKKALGGERNVYV